MNASRKHKRVLIVEDDLCLKTVLLRVIKNFGQDIEVEWATSVEDALSLIIQSQRGSPEKHFDLILADIVLDGNFSGFDLFRICRTRNFSAQFVMSSGMSVDTYFKAFGKKGPYPAFLKKPYSIQECEEIISDALKPEETKYGTASSHS